MKRRTRWPSTSPTPVDCQSAWERPSAPGASPSTLKYATLDPVGIVTVAVVLFAIAGIAALLGKKKVAEVGSPAPERAMSGLKQDIATVKGERR